MFATLGSAVGGGEYPFRLQLVGAQTWRLHPAAAEITVEDATLGVTRARLRFGALIHEPALPYVAMKSRWKWSA